MEKRQNRCGDMEAFRKGDRENQFPPPLTEFNLCKIYLGTKAIRSSNVDQNNINTLSRCPQMYFRFQACITVYPAFCCVYLFSLLCCQHKERHLRKKSVQKSDETKIRKTAGNGEMMKTREGREEDMR